MNTVTLNCFENFKCIDKKCTDNCCIGWEIDIDEDTLKYYKSLKGVLGKRIRSSISNDAPCHFIMDSRGRCPFLNEDNLCDIILSLGEDKIPYICKNHPRFFEWFPNRTEMGIGLACEEGARLIFSENEKLKLTAMCDSSSDVLTYARDTAFYVLQQRNIPFNRRLIIFLNFAYELDDLLFMGETEKIRSLSDTYKDDAFLESKFISLKGKNLTSEFIRFFYELEQIDKSWKDFLDLIIKYEKKLNKEKFLSEIKWTEYENLAVYFIFRYFLKAKDDNDVLSKAKLTVISVIFNILMDMTTFTHINKINRISNAKLYSKELEYSEENVNFIYEQSIDNELFSHDNLSQFINYLLKT